METSKTIEKCINKIKYLIDRYKEAKEWNRKQSGGSKNKTLFYDEIGAVLGCRDIVTLSHVSDAGTTGTHAGIHMFTKFLKNVTSTSKKNFFQNSLTVKNVFH